MEMSIPIFGVLAVVLVCALPFLFILGIVWLIIAGMRGGSKQQSISTEETRMIQEMFMGLQRMEARVDALETILLDKMKKDDKA